MNKFYILFLAVFIVPLTSFGDNIQGRWVRQITLSDSNPGCFGNIIEIQANQQFFNGTLVAITNDASANGYRAGDVKWQHISKQDASNYVFRGMIKRSGLSEAFNRPIYVDCKLTVLSDNRIKVQAFSPDFNFLGDEQIWEKLDPS